jgi:MOSC domain-containing protein YiiM
MSEAFVGRLVAIYTTADAGAPMVARSEIAAEAGVGLVGDRYATRTGSFSGRPGTGREVTLLAREAIAAVNAEGEVRIGEHETRRNLVTEGVPLADLVDRTFRVGDVVLHGRRLAEPCAYLERMTRAGVRDALSHRGGLRADIVTSGILRVGDEIREVEARDVVARG